MPFSITRRAFVSSVAAAGAAGLAGAAPKRKYKYIDMHVHLGAFYWGKEVTPEGLVRWMDEHDVERAVILPLVSPEATIYVQPTEAALAASKKFPDRLVAFCAIDPRSNYPRGYNPGVKGLVGVLKKWKDAGARGFGEHKVGLPFDHPLMMDLYAACDELELPILFHLDDVRGIDTPGLPRLERALRSFPKLPVIGHAAGFWASISGDALFVDFSRYRGGPITPGGALDKLMGKYPNLYGDLSEPGGYNAIHRDPAFGRDFLIRRADQLVFGTDYLMPGQEIPHFALYDSLDLPDDVQRRIFRANALKLLKLNG
jgi:predicted TIM-barrel fold metal-dependent hydrolase